MIREILSYLRDFLFLAHDTRGNKASIRRLEKEVTDLVRMVEKLTYEMESLKETERLEREKLALQLQTVLAQFAFHLPPVC